MKIIYTIIISILSINIVKANTYENEINIEENENIEKIINYAYNNIENFENKNYIIFQDSTGQYIIGFKEYEISNNNIIMKNTEIIKINETGITKTEEQQTTLIKNKLFLSNLKIDNSMINRDIQERQERRNIRLILTFILGIILAILLTKERKCY